MSKLTESQWGSLGALLDHHHIQQEGAIREALGNDVAPGTRLAALTKEQGDRVIAHLEQRPVGEVAAKRASMTSHERIAEHRASAKVARQSARVFGRNRDDDDRNDREGGQW